MSTQLTRYSDVTASRGLTSIQVLGKFTQGSIFSNYLDRDGVDCHGFVVSARCDIEQRKYRYITVIPVYTLDLWMANYGNEVARQNAERTLHKEMGKALGALQFPPDALDIYGVNEVLNLVPNTKATSAARDKISSYARIISGSHEEHKDLTQYISARRNVVTEIMKGRLHGIYFLERIRPGEVASGYVVDFRCPEPLPVELLDALARGIEHDELMRSFKKYSSSIRVMDGDIACFVSLVNSPFIEHIMQAFANTFIRIGLDDIPEHEIDAIKVRYEK